MEGARSYTGQITSAVGVAANEATPACSVSGASSVNEGAPYTLSDSFNDPGGDAVDHLVINWGDGTSNGYWGNPGSATHTYLTAPPGGASAFNVTAAITTEDGTYNSSNSVAVQPVYSTVSVATATSPATEQNRQAAVFTVTRTGGLLSIPLNVNFTLGGTAASSRYQVTDA